MTFVLNSFILKPVGRVTPLHHLIKEMRQKTEYVTKLVYNSVLNSN